MTFRTQTGRIVPALTADQMREVDRIAVEEFGLGILPMMENAGRHLADNAAAMLGPANRAVTVLAGAGGNGGGGLCCARHLRNRSVEVSVVLDREPSELGDAARAQLRTLSAAGLAPLPPAGAGDALRRSAVVVDALIGYGLRGEPRAATARLINECNRLAERILSLDVPSGLDATTGENPGAVVRAARTLTLALPKTGLARIPGELYLADIGIPPEVFARAGLRYHSPFVEGPCLRLHVEDGAGD